ncbi:MAG: hypothetical protein GVY13_11340 [Alphaproteobacteria bacterium]|jgi:hypothetical protein|nr:hypothetical protein [Alphaproteobacteria bacterium]
MAELTLHDEETCELATQLAERLNVSTDEAVRVALRAYQPIKPLPSGSIDEQDKARRLGEFDELTKRIAAKVRPGTHETDDEMLYDGFGLPK